MKYTVSYIELLGRTFIVNADSEKEAREKVLNAVKNEAIVLTADDYVMDSGEIADCWYADTADMEFYPALELFID